MPEPDAASMPYSETISIPAYRFKAFWRVAAASTFADRFSPDVELIYHPAASFVSGQLELKLEEDATAHSTDLTRKRKLKLRLAGGAPVPFGGVFIDLRANHYFNWSHHVNSFLPMAIYARERSGLPLTVLLPEGMPVGAVALYRRFGFDSLLSDAPVRGRQLVWRMDPMEAFSSYRHHMIERFMRAHDGDEAVFPRIEDLPKKIFVARKDTRRISNQAEVEAVLVPLGYRTVYMEEHSNEVQFALVRGATHIVGIHGAGLAPLQYYSPAREPLHFVEIQPPGCTSNFFQIMADQIGARYSAVRGRLKPEYIEPSYDGTPLTRFTSDDFEVDPLSVRVAIEINRRGGVIEDYPRNWFAD
ncbi:MAG TPA: glycosyltransferase family 61 protein [Allosphingosinicella sp.]|jgi:capsular polysaccharide biosynthesis protein